MGFSSFIFIKEIFFFNGIDILVVRLFRSSIGYLVNLVGEFAQNCDII